MSKSRSFLTLPTATEPVYVRAEAIAAVIPTGESKCTVKLTSLDTVEVEGISAHVVMGYLDVLDNPRPDEQTDVLNLTLPGSNFSVPVFSEPGSPPPAERQ